MATIFQLLLTTTLTISGSRADTYSDTQGEERKKRSTHGTIVLLTATE